MSKKRILIIDDEASFTRLLNLNLGCTGKYTLRAENSSPEGMAAVREFRPDLILLDVMMPQVDGGTLAARIQSDSRFSQIPIVFLTAAVRKDEVQGRNGLIGGFSYLAKPVDLKQLLACIEKNLMLPAHGTAERASGTRRD
jgi:CheY-like chemotaxis protein